LSQGPVAKNKNKEDVMERIKDETFRKALLATALLGFSAVTVYFTTPLFKAVHGYLFDLLGPLYPAFLILSGMIFASLGMVVSGVSAGNHAVGEDAHEPVLKELLFVEEVAPLVGFLGTVLALYWGISGLDLDVNNLVGTVLKFLGQVGKSLSTTAAGLVVSLSAKLVRERVAASLLGRQREMRRAALRAEDVAEIEN
jgi:hypothetical protein